MAKESYIIYVDTGGTFTDAVVVGQDGNFVTGKADTTPDDLQISFFGAISNAAEKMGKSVKDVVEKASQIGYGTTFGTNMVVSGNPGPKLGFITTKGVENRLFQWRLRTAGIPKGEAMHMISSGHPEPLLPRELVVGVTERIDYRGEVVVPLQEDQVKKAVEELVEAGVEGIGIGFLWSFLNDSHEKRAKEIVEEMVPDLLVAGSAEVTPVIKEYSRFTSLLIDLKIGKGLRNLLKRIELRLAELGCERPLLVMQAIGGTCQSKIVQPGTTLHSGPVGGMAGVKYFKELYGLKNAMGSDVGGTSFDVTVVPETDVRFLRAPIVGRYEIGTPMCEIITIGSGGGTIAWIEKISNTLRLGPHSAGSTPGPVCYDAGGTEPTVTDADVVLGRIDPNFFFGGKRKLNKDKAIAAIKEKIAEPLGLDVYDAAEGICKIVDSAMGSLLKQAIAAKGIDPSQYTLMVFGGGGPPHGAGYSAGLGFEKIIIPACASVFSAFGASTSDVTHRYETSPLIAVSNLPFSPITLKFELENVSLANLSSEAVSKFNTMFETLEERAYSETGMEGYSRSEVMLKHEFLGRYGGQLWEIPVSSPVSRIMSDHDLRALIDSFETEYVKTYTKGAMVPGGGVEITSIAVTATVSASKPVMIKRPYVGADASQALKGTRQTYYEGSWQPTNIYAMDRLQVGNIIDELAIIEAEDTTVIIPRDRRVTVDEYLNLVMEER